MLGCVCSNSLLTDSSSGASSQLSSSFSCFGSSDDIIANACQYCSAALSETGGYSNGFFVSAALATAACENKPPASIAQKTKDRITFLLMMNEDQHSRQ